MKLITDIKDFYHGTDLLNYYCEAKSLTEGDLFLTLKPTQSKTIDELSSLVESILNEHPLKCIGVIEAERSLFQTKIQNYQDQFIPNSFFHCHLIAKNCPDVINFQKSWVDQNDEQFLSFDKREVYNINGLITYFSKQINNNPTFGLLVN